MLYRPKYSRLGICGEQHSIKINLPTNILKTSTQTSYGLRYRPIRFRFPAETGFFLCCCKSRSTVGSNKVSLSVCYWQISPYKSDVTWNWLHLCLVPSWRLSGASLTVCGFIKKWSNYTYFLLQKFVLIVAGLNVTIAVCGGIVLMWGELGVGERVIRCRDTDSLGYTASRICGINLDTWAYMIWSVCKNRTCFHCHLSKYFPYTGMWRRVVWCSVTKVWMQPAESIVDVICETSVHNNSLNCVTAWRSGFIVSIVR